MKLLDRLERHFGRLAVPNLAVVLVLGQAISWLLALARPDLPAQLALIPVKVLDGEVWRLITFVIVPPMTNAIFVFFALYLLYLFGTSLESEWGTFKFNAYVFVACIATILTALLNPGGVYGPMFIDLSIFLAFARLYPEFELYIFFVLPVQVRYLAWIVWAGIILAVLFFPVTIKIMALAAVANYLLFFGRDIWIDMKAGRRRMANDAKQAHRAKQALHRCEVCGATEKSHPQVDFRVCAQCNDGQEYCTEHIAQHDHV